MLLRDVFHIDLGVRRGPSAQVSKYLLAPVRRISKAEHGQRAFIILIGAPLCWNNRKIIFIAAGSSVVA
jgi:hypothetical protein